jgi:hypothetical protein
MLRSRRSGGHCSIRPAGHRHQYATRSFSEPVFRSNLQHKHLHRLWGGCRSGTE